VRVKGSSATPWGFLVQQVSSWKLCWYSALIACLLAPITAGAEPQADFPVLPLPPPVEGLVGLSKPPLLAVSHMSGSSDKKLSNAVSHLRWLTQWRRSRARTTRMQWARLARSV
jgi:hypothetical protein